MMTPTDSDQRMTLARQFFARIPHCKSLGIEPIAVGTNTLTAQLPYQLDLVGNPLTGVIHGGVITTLVDQTSGGAATAALNDPHPVSTLDLRIDYMRPARPHESALAHAVCYKLTAQVAFVRCTVYQENFDEPIATSMSTFMRTAGSVASMVGGAK